MFYSKVVFSEQLYFSYGLLISPNPIRTILFHAASDELRVVTQKQTNMTE